MARAVDWNDLEDLTAPVQIKRPKSNRIYEVYRRGSDLYQAAYELDAEGKEVYRVEHRIEYILGSGANGFSCIVQRDEFLFQAPLSYYSRTRAWGLSPGYDQQDQSFTRPIHADCISCHSGRPQPIENTDGKFRDPPFRELPIACESCHGPGALHVERRRTGARPSGPVDRSIVNPAKLPGWLADNICMSCHQAMDATALMPGKQVADFRPGTPLTNTFAIFAVPFRPDAPPKEPLLQHFTLMSLSRCYLESGRKLSCITCHDPHVQPTAEEAPAYFRSKCLTCHTEKSCNLPLQARRAKSPPDDCVGCHMPKQRLKDISHSSLTAHRILAREGEPLPAVAFQLTSPSLPDLVHLNSIPGAPQEPIPPLTLFRAYGRLIASHTEYRARFDSILETLAAAKSQDSVVLSRLGMKEMGKGAAQSQVTAADYFQQALRAGSTASQDVELLAMLQAKAGKPQEAIATVTRGLEASPYSPRLYRLLAALYVLEKARGDALRTMKKDLEFFPEDTYMRTLVKSAESEGWQESNPPQNGP